jgi:hypothetical protein
MSAQPVVLSVLFLLLFAAACSDAPSLPYSETMPVDSLFDAGAVADTYVSRTDTVATEAPPDLGPADISQPFDAPSSGIAGSCDYRHLKDLGLQGLCTSYTGYDWSAAKLSAQCVAASGVWLASPCSSQDLVGFCTMNAGGKREAVLHFYSDYQNAFGQSGRAAAYGSCYGSGDWTDV